MSKHCQRRSAFSCKIIKWPLHHSMLPLHCGPGFLADPMPGASDPDHRATGAARHTVQSVHGWHLRARLLSDMLGLSHHISLPQMLVWKRRLPDPQFWESTIIRIFHIEHHRTGRKYMLLWSAYDLKHAPRNSHTFRWPTVSRHLLSHRFRLLLGSLAVL